MTDHLNALRIRLSNERARHAVAKTQAERDLRAVWIGQMEREIAGELEFLAAQPLPDMTDNELLAELTR